MMNVEFFKKQIEAMDVKSDEFFELYCAIADKYYTFPNPDDYQQAVMTLRMYIDKASGGGLENQLITFQKLLEQLFHMDKNGSDAAMGTVGFKGKDYHFTLATSTKALKTMQDTLAKVVKGDFKLKVKNKGKKK